MENHLGVELSEFMGQLRFDIDKTWWEGQANAVALEVGPVELEITVQVEKSADAKFGVRFWVIDASASGNLSATNTQRIKLTLTPRDRRDPTRSLFISGDAEDDEDLPDSTPDE